MLRSMKVVKRFAERRGGWVNPRRNAAPSTTERKQKAALRRGVA